MSIQNINISKLMDNYTDEEFFIDGKSAVSAKIVTKRVMGQIPGKKVMLRPKVVLTAAALAATVGVLVAAAEPHGFIESKTGTKYEFYNHCVEIRSPGIDFDADLEVEPYTVENGRVYFTVDDQNVDITDYFERGENYYYKYSDTDAQGANYDIVLAVGGDISNPSYGEMIFTLNENSVFRGLGAARFNNSSDVYCYYKDGQVVVVETPDQRAESTNYPYRNLHYICYMEFAHQMDIWEDDVVAGREIDVNDIDRSIEFKREYSEWIYPEGWSGETVSNYIPELPEVN